MNILVTDGEYKHALGIVRALGKAGYNVFVASNKNSFNISGYSKYCSKGFITSNIYEIKDENKYIDEFKFIIKENDIELVIPVSYINCFIFSKYKAELSNMTNIVIADFKTIQLASNKKDTLEYAKRIGVNIPQTFYPTTINDVERISEKISYPCVVKSRLEHGYNLVYYPNNAIELRNIYKNIVERYQFSRCNYPIIQEYIEGDGYGFFALYINGECKQIFMHHRIREYPLSGGASVKAESYYDKKLLEYGKRILDGLKWHGVAMVEFKKDNLGQYKLMEINPKYWGSVDLALEAGAKFPVLTAKYIAGENIGYSEEYKRNLQYHWPLHGDWKHAFKNPKKIPTVLCDCLNAKVKSNLWIRDDIKVTFLMLFYLINWIINKIKNKLSIPVMRNNEL